MKRVQSSVYYIRSELHIKATRKDIKDILFRNPLHDGMKGIVVLDEIIHYASYLSTLTVLLGIGICGAHFLTSSSLPKVVKCDL